MLYTEIMTENREFQTCYHKGMYLVSRYVTLYARQNGLPYNRLGITTSKKIGNAVCRSRARRIIRQAWREQELHAPVGLDVVIVARVHITEADSGMLSHWLHRYGMPALHKMYAGKFRQYAGRQTQ